MPPVEHPIMMSPESVAAYYDGRKTQTRRVMRPQPQLQHVNIPGDPGKLWMWDPGKKYDVIIPVGNPSVIQYCPYGHVAENLWFRETYHLDPSDQHFVIFKDGGKKWIDGRYEPWRGKEPFDPKSLKGWRAWLPRWGARIVVPIVSIRVERVQAISMNDCIEEGVQIPVTTKDCPEGKARPLIQLTGPKGFAPCNYLPAEAKRVEADYYRSHYASVWDSLNAGRGYPWASKMSGAGYEKLDRTKIIQANPYVWVIEFERFK